jgi:hypothetical protein
LLSRYSDREDLWVRVLMTEFRGMPQGPDQSHFLNQQQPLILERAQQERSNVVLQWLYAHSLLRQNKVDSARIRLQEIVDRSPAFELAFRSLAEVELKSCRADSALDLGRWSVSLAQPADRPQAYAVLSKAYWLAKKLDTAKLILDFALNRYPSDTSLLAAKAQFLESNGDLEAARLTLEKWGTVHKEDVRPRLWLSNLGRNPLPQCLGKGSGRANPTANVQADWSQLGALIDTLIREDSTNTILYSLAARYALLAGQTDQAMVSIQAGLGFDSTDKRLLAMRRLAENSVQTAPSQGKTLSKSEMQNGSSGQVLFGEYLVPWGAGRADFFQVYDGSRFRTRDSSLFLTDETMGSLRQRLAIRFDSTGFYQMTGVIIDHTRNADPLGRVLRHKSQNAGAPIPSSDLKCGSQQWNVFSWESSEMTELVAQPVSRSWEVRLLRLWGKKRTGNETLCALLDRIEGSTR